MLVEEAVRLCTKVSKTGDWTLLAQSPLVQSPLVRAIIGETPVADPALCGSALYVLMQWAIDQLKPVDEPDAAAYAWRAYTVLYYPCFQVMPVATLAARLAISEQTVYQSRRNALARLAQLLMIEARTLQAAASLRHAWTRFRYQQYTPVQQQILGLAAVSPLPLAAATFHQLLQQMAPMPEAQQQAIIDQLLHDGALVRQLPSDNIGAAPLFRQVLTTDFTHELPVIHRSVALFYEGRADVLAAAYHWQATGEAGRAATLLLDQQRLLINHGHTGALLSQLQTFTPAYLDPAQWVKLKILAGDLALQLQDVGAALDEYQQALHTEIAELQALAYHRRGRALLALNVDEALLHYERATQALAARPDHPLHIRIQTDKAWLFIQEKANLTQAERILRQLETQVSATNRLGLSYLANAWAGFYHQRGDDGLALEQRRRAWQLAQETQDLEWQMHTSRNLGNDYVELQQYGEALTWFDQSRTLAVRLGDRAMVGMGEKAIGECHFWLGDHDQARRHYAAAYELLKAADRQNWLAYVCYDLAEVYAQAWEVETMRLYVAEGRQLCHQVRNQRLLTILVQLADAFTWFDRLNSRQQVGVRATKSAGAITNRGYQALTGCAHRQAVRDLNELCAWGILQRKGEGRTVHYVSALSF